MLRLAGMDTTALDKLPRCERCGFIMTLDQAKNECPVCKDGPHAQDRPMLYVILAMVVLWLGVSIRRAFWR